MTDFTKVFPDSRVLLEELKEAIEETPKDENNNVCLGYGLNSKKLDKQKALKGIKRILASDNIQASKYVSQYIEILAKVFLPKIYDNKNKEFCEYGVFTVHYIHSPYAMYKDKYPIRFLGV